MKKLFNVLGYSQLVFFVISVIGVAIGMFGKPNHWYHSLFPFVIGLEFVTFLVMVYLMVFKSEEIQ